MVVITEFKDLDQFIEGQVLLLNKDYEWTSFDLVKKVKNIIERNIRQKLNVKIKRLKVGHAGTLDPLAVGLMILCTGKATKKISELQGMDKEYIAKLEIGRTTPCFDLEKDYDHEYPTEHITKELVHSVLNNFVGEQDQVPPIFSAKYVNGKRAYEYARKGQEPELKANRISIHEIELLEYDFPKISIRIACSKGTYIRSLARDIGVALNSGAHLTGLIRTKIGDYLLNNADTVKEFEEKVIKL